MEWNRDLTILSIGDIIWEESHDEIRFVAYVLNIPNVESVRVKIFRIWDNTTMTINWDPYISFNPNCCYFIQKHEI